MLKEERQRKILDLVRTEGQVRATELEAVFDVSGYTVRRDLDELAGRQELQRVHGGALARSQVANTYEGRQQQGVAGKIATARAAAALLEPGQVVILDSGSTALHLVDAIPSGLTATFVTHSPVVATALAGHGGLDVVLVGGTLDRATMSLVGAETLAGFRGLAADICFLGVWSLHAEKGITNRYYEEAQVRNVLLESADRVVALASAPKLGTVAPFAVGPAAALTHLATEPGVPAEVLRPFEDLGIRILR